MTRAQVEVVKDLLAWHYEPGMIVRPREAYPNRDNQDNARRRTLRGLVGLGLLEETSDGYLVMERLVQAYREWWQTKGFRDPGESNVLLP